MVLVIPIGEYGYLNQQPNNMKKATKASIITIIATTGIVGGVITLDKPITQEEVQQSYCAGKTAILVDRQWHCYENDKYTGRKNALIAKVKNNTIGLDDAMFAVGVIRREKMPNLMNEIKKKYKKNGEISKAEQMILISTTDLLNGQPIILEDVTQDNLIDKLINNQ